MLNSTTFTSNVALSQPKHDPESLWQLDVPRVAWGTVLLFALIISGYILVYAGLVYEFFSLTTASVICCVCCYASFTVVHDAGHGSLFRQDSGAKKLEGLIGWIASIPLLLAPFRFFQKMHDRHHAFTNDPERDPDYFNCHGNLALVLINGLLLPLRYHLMALTIFRQDPHFRKTFFSTSVYLVLIWLTIAMLCAQGYFWEVVALVLIPMLFALIMLTLFFDYIPHHPHTALHRMHNTRVYPSRIINLLIFGQNYHLVHHLYPRVPWYKYRITFERLQGYLRSQNAPIENIWNGKHSELLHSVNTQMAPNSGSCLNMVLRVKKVKKLTEHSVLISFELPKELDLKFNAGQYITVSKWLQGRHHTRCYSICDSPEHVMQNKEISIAVKELSGGVMSTYLNRQLTVGQSLIVKGPFGDFAYSGGEAKSKQMVLIAGGSGITPVMSIAKHALSQADIDKVQLLFANRCRNETLFLEELNELQQMFPQRLDVKWFYSQETELQDGENSKLTRRDIAQLCCRLIHLSSVQFYLCGPNTLIEETKSVLNELNVPSGNIHQERFISSQEEPKGKRHTVTITASHTSEVELAVAENQTILNAAKLVNISLPHACENGTCGSCKCLLITGETQVLTGDSTVLTKDEIEQGYRLACQSKPKTALILQVD